MTFVITGVTGHTGAVAAETLLAQGKKVRVVVRDAAKGEPWKAKGAEVAVAAFGDEAALTKALAGAEGAYLLLPPNMTSNDVLADQQKLADTIVRAVAASKVKHVVFLSSVGAQHAAGTGPVRTLHHVETKLREVPGLASTFLRAAYFMENNGAALAGLAGGVFPTFLTVDKAISQVATHDIGTVAARLLVEGGSGVSVVELAGPRDYSPADVAAALGKLVGKTLTVQHAPEEAIVPAFMGFGMTQSMAGLYLEMIHGINVGHMTWEGGKARSVRGETPIETVLAKLLGK